MIFKTKVYLCKNGQPWDTPFCIKKGLDGLKYAVFNNEYEAADFAKEVLNQEDTRLYCFGRFMNAVCLEEDEEGN